MYVCVYVLLWLVAGVLHYCCSVVSPQSIHLKRAELKQLEEERLSQVSLDPPPQPVANQTGAYPQDNSTKDVQEEKVEGEPHTQMTSRSHDIRMYTHTYVCMYVCTFVCV